MVDGSDSQLNVTNGFNLALNGNTGTLTYRNNSNGSWGGTVNLANSGNAATVAVLKCIVWCRPRHGQFERWQRDGRSNRYG